MRRILAFSIAAAALLLPVSAHAKCYVREYKTVATIGASRAPLAPEVGSAIDQVVDPSGGVASSNPFNATTLVVRLICGSSVSFVIGPSPQTATTTNAVLAAMQPEYFAVTPGQVVSFILNSSP